MNPSYRVLTLIYQALSADSELSGLVEEICVSGRRSDRSKTPALMVTISSDIRSTSLAPLSEIVVDVSVESREGDGEDTVNQKIFDAVDAIMDEHTFSDATVTTHLNRRGLPVWPAVFDPESQHYYKRWRYRGVVKQLT